MKLQTTQKYFRSSNVENIISQFPEPHISKSKGYVTPTLQVQIDLISSTEKVHATRFRVNMAKKNLFSNGKNSTQGNTHNNLDKISSTLDESDLDEENNSCDEYIPESEHTSEDNSSLEADDFRQRKKELLVIEVSIMLIKNVT